MKIKFLLILFTLLPATSLYSKTIVNGYYVTLNGDTIQTRFLINDLFALHHTLVCIDPSDNVKQFSPHDILAFSFKTQSNAFSLSKFFDNTRSIDELNHSHDDMLLKDGYFYKHKNFSLNAEINAASVIDDSVELYKSIETGNGTKLFLSVDNTQQSPLQAAVYYTKLQQDKPYLTAGIWVLIKNNQIIARQNKKPKDWIAEAISDYKTLSALVKTKKINSFPWDFTPVVNDYNNWLATNKPDTSLYLKGFIEAQNHYHAILPFALSYITGTAFFLPGMISTVIVAHNPKESHMKIPAKLPLRDNIDYQKGFRHKAFEKKYMSAGRGCLLGIPTCIVLAVLFL